MNIKFPKDRISAFGFTKSAPYVGEPDYFGLLAMEYAGNIVEARPVSYSRPPVLPEYLRGVFNTLKAQAIPAQLVTVRRLGMRERADGRHFHHYLVPAEARLKVVGMTL